MTHQTYLSDDETLKPVSPFSPDYVSQLPPERRRQFKVPKLQEQVPFIRDNISTEKPEKKYRMIKASI